LRFDHRIFVRLAPVLLGVLLVGCAHAPPDDAFADGVAAAGVQEPIEFTATSMPTDADGQEIAGEITIEDAVRRALRCSPSVQADIAEVRVALAEARQTRLLPNPVISVAVRLPEGGGTPVIEAGLAADLLSLLLRPRQIRAADNRLRAASAEALTTTLDLVAEVQDRYVTVQSLDAQGAVLEQRRTLLRRLLDLARARVEAGESSRLDVLTLDVERVSLDVEIAQAASARREQRLALARLLGRPSGRTVWQLSPWAPPAAAAATVDEMQWVRAALKHRPEVQAQHWNLAALGDEGAVAGFAAFDSADVGVDAERDNGDWSVGPAIAAPLPLLDWGQQRRAKAEAQRAAARHRLTRTRRQIVEEVRRAVESLAASQAALRRVHTELIPLTEQRVQQAEAAYKNGLADVTAVLLAEQEAQVARSKLIELQQAASSATYRLQRAVGGAGIVASIPTPATTTTSTTAETIQR
jgi:outer membrane protein TolC